jgi:EAL domain-containing protein (putative c-di-GMP-specific phosphodiesterase class I)
MPNDIIELIPYFQPIISMSKKDVFGVEVLARGLDASGSLVYPDRLFCGSDADAHKRIDRIIREKALSGLSAFPPEWRIFINMLPNNFLGIRDIEKQSHLLKTCRKYNISYDRVVIEITEKATDRFPEIAPILKEYARLGFQIAIDDWGAEYSNFDRLALLLPSIVKFDARFLWRATSTPSIAEIFCAAVTMALKLGINVIVEGIEKEEHLYMALDAGCPLAQGYLFARPGKSVQNRNQFGTLLNKAFLNYREGKVHHLITEKKRVRHYMDDILNNLRHCFDADAVYDDLYNALLSILPEHGELINAYILNHGGIQISPNLSCECGEIRINEHMINRDWSWRPYYIHTLVNQRLFESKYTITGPYVDPNNGISMFTVCIIIGQYMLCMDLANDMAM